MLTSTRISQTHRALKIMSKARDSKEVICATSTSIKSLMLNFSEMMRHLDHARTGWQKPKSGLLLNFRLSSIVQRFKDNSLIKEIEVNPEDGFYFSEILKLFHSGLLLLEEVDLLIHPLKIELNCPVDDKLPLEKNSKIRVKEDNVTEENVNDANMEDAVNLVECKDAPVTTVASMRQNALASKIITSSVRNDARRDNNNSTTFTK